MKGAPTTCPWCLAPALRTCWKPGPTAKPGWSAWAKCSMCRSSLFAGGAWSSAATARATARLRAVIDEMGAWQSRSGLTPSEARSHLLAEARSRGGDVVAGIEGQVSDCLACRRSEALIAYLDGRGRLRIWCSACRLGLYVGSDLGLPGVLTVFKDLSPLILRLKFAPAQVREPGPEVTQVSTSDAEGAHG